MTDAVLALNAGSSSVKFALASADDLNPFLEGLAERLTTPEAVIHIRQPGGGTERVPVPSASHGAALEALFDAATRAAPGHRIRAVGHRVVHGGTDFVVPTRVDSAVLGALRALCPLAPLHQEAGLAGIDAAIARYPDAVQIAAFDTAFHAGKPFVNDAYGLPRDFYERGIRRYGFHGLACEAVVAALSAEDYPVSHRCLALAHLGSGCSVTAVRGGQSVANSMGFSALDGLTMGTRCGSLDPGVVLHLLRNGQDAESLEDLLYRRSGLLGLSGLSNDMRDLEAARTEPARRAIDHFIARVVQEICRMAGAMGGLDAVVFSGGIGENADAVRTAVMDGLAFLPGRDGNGIDTLVCAADEARVLLRAARDLA